MALTNLFRILRFFIVIFVIIGSLFCLYYITKFTYPFIIALMVAFIMNPLVNFLEIKVNITRPIAVFLSILFILAIITGIITLLVVELINGTTYLAEQIPNHFKSLVTYFQEFIAHQLIPIYQKLTSLLSTLDASQQTAIMNNIQSIGGKIASAGASVIKSLLQKIPIALSNLPNYVSVLIFSLLGTFFISKDWYKLKGMFQKVTPQWVSESSGDVIRGLKKALFGFVKAQFTLISITAVIVLFGLLILRVDYAITIAIIIGLIDLLPYLGTGIIFIPWILYMFFTGNYFLTIGLTILYITIVVQRQLMEPKVLSDSIGLNPLATLIALFVGFQLWSFAGLIIGPVALVIINTLNQAGIFEQIWKYINEEKQL